MAPATNAVASQARRGDAATGSARGPIRTNAPTARNVEAPAPRVSPNDASSAAAASAARPKRPNSPDAIVDRLPMSVTAGLSRRAEPTAAGEAVYADR